MADDFKDKRLDKIQARVRENAANSMYPLHTRKKMNKSPFAYFKSCLHAFSICSAKTYYYTRNRTAASFAVTAITLGAFYCVPDIKTSVDSAVKKAVAAHNKTPHP